MKPLFVLHVDNEIVHDVIDGVLYSVPPNEPYEFSNPYFGRKFIEHKWFHGVVEVELRKVPRGWEFQVEDAVRRAQSQLASADRAYYEAYIETQHQDRLLQGRPAAPPSERQKKILRRQGINLEDYGIRPVGTKSTQDKMLEAVMTQNQTMMGLLAAILSGEKITPAHLAGMGATVAAASQTEKPEVEEVYVGQPKAPASLPRNIIVPTVPDVPEPPKREVRFFNDGEEPATLSLDNLGPEFGGDVNDPNQMPGSGGVVVVDNPVDLHDSGLAEALQSVGKEGSSLRIPVKPAKKPR